ncbi:hypothetical protein ACVWZ4_002852 [Bradyrhizobium sp. USDA 4472]
MWDWFRRLYWRLYNKLVPLPSDEVLSARLRSLLESRNIEKTPPEEMPAAASCCIVTFDDGGTVCSPDITYTNGLFSFNAGAKLEAQREQNFTEQLIWSIKDIRTEMMLAQEASRKLGTEVDSFRCPIADTNLAGELGLVKSAEMAFTSEGLNLNTKLSGSSGAFGGYVSFVISKNLNAVGPTWTLTHFKGPGSLAGIAEVNTDKLTFAFAERSATESLARAAQTTRAVSLLNYILTNQISTQLGTLRGLPP